MLSKTQATPREPSDPQTTRDRVSDSVNDSRGEPVLTTARAREAAAAANGTETRGEHFRRKAHRTRLHGYAIATVALVAYLIALAASNTSHVKVDWVFGSSHVSLVWLVLFAAILGWLLGLVMTARFHWRTRAPRTHRGGR